MAELEAMAAPHSECLQAVRDIITARGIEATVSDYRPGMVMPAGLDDLAMECPHGIRVWAEPTPEQRMKWAEECVR